MTQNQLMTYAAAAFAGFALWYITRKPGNAAAAQPAQQARDAGLQHFLTGVTAQFDQLSYSPVVMTHDSAGNLVFNRRAIGL